MEFIKSLFVWRSKSESKSKSKKVDFISELPMEISHKILRKLDAESLMKAPQVSRSWESICASDPILRKTGRNYIKEEERMNARPKAIIIDSEYEATAFRIYATCMAMDITLPVVRIYGSSSGRMHREEIRFFNLQ
jgi:hypothetical protein